MKKFNVGIIGATGIVGQRFLDLLDLHPWFNVTCLAASSRSKGKTYKQAVANRWFMKNPIPSYIKDMIIHDAVEDAKVISSKVDFVFCAVDMPKSEVIQLEEKYAKYECILISNNSANRYKNDIPMIIPEVNPHHTDIIPYQQKRLGTKRGFIAVKSNCSIQSYVPALSSLSEYGIKKVLACTYQAISGAGKIFDNYDQIIDNVIPYIAGEEKKSEVEPLKVFGKINNGIIENENRIEITTQCLRVPVSDGHLAAVFATFDKKVNVSEIIDKWNNYISPIDHFNLPSSPKKMIYYMSDIDRPQPKLDRNIDNGMGITVGRLRKDSQYDIKFVSLSHNTVRGAAGGAILMAELLVAKGYIK